jgi:hypothetical protein
MKRRRAPKALKIATTKVFFMDWGKINLTRKPMKRKVVKVKPRCWRSRL